MDERGITAKTYPRWWLKAGTGKTTMVDSAMYLMGKDKTAHLTPDRCIITEPTSEWESLTSVTAEYFEIPNPLRAGSDSRMFQKPIKDSGAQHRSTPATRRALDGIGSLSVSDRPYRLPEGVSVGDLVFFDPRGERSRDDLARARTRIAEDTPRVVALGRVSS